jgi:hypothetical protein
VIWKATEGHTAHSRQEKASCFARDAGTTRWSPDYWVLPHPRLSSVTGPWLRKKRRPRGKAARREERLQRRLLRDGHSQQLLARLRNAVRRKLVTVVERRQGSGA